ncbi:hypothetical protein YC2023_049997 [Brassica napus]
MKDTLCFGEEVFEGMTNLRFLRIYGISQEDKEIGLEFRHLNLSTLKWWDGSRKPLKEGKYYMGRQLRLLEWWGYPMWRLPSYICAENLVELIMPDSRLTMLWTGVQDDTKRMYGISFNISEMEQRLARDERLKGMKRLKVMRMYKDSLYGQEVRVHLVIGLHSLWERLSNI